MTDDDIYAIESDVPIPAPDRMRYPFDKMAVGDSFVFPPGKVHLVRSASQAFARRHNGMQFKLRKIDEIWRCWRTN